MVILLAIAACAQRTEDGCLEPRLEMWCNHVPGEGPDEDGGECELPTLDSEQAADLARECGRWLAVTEEEAFGLWGSVQYYDKETGELVAVRYWSDEEDYCGGTTYTYGQDVHCAIKK